jgi:hypothetical protein
MDADTYQQVAVPAAARLTEKENSEVVSTSQACMNESVNHANMPSYHITISQQPRLLQGHHHHMHPQKTLVLNR